MRRLPAAQPLMVINGNFRELPKTAPDFMATLLD